MSLINIGMSGLNASQFALNTTGNNISNSGTAGYNRQQVDTAEMGSQYAGSGFLGKGVLVKDVGRVYDKFLANQVNQSQSQYSQLNSYYQQIAQINNALGSSTTGISASMSKFFTDLQSIVTQPNNSATRATVISSAQTLTSMFQSLSGSISQLRDSVNGSMTQSVEQINTYAKSIAKLNDAIIQAKASGDGSTPNDLLDQRDQAVAKLNELIQTDVVKNDDGSYNVFVGNGQSLVMSTASYQLATVPSQQDASQLTVAYVSPNGTKVPLQESSIAGGSLGGLIAFRAGALTTAQNSLGQVALSLTSTFNQQNKLGLDLHGDAGQDFFSVPSPTVIGNKNNADDSQIKASITDGAKVTTSDYQVSYDGSSYQLTRLDDGETWTAGSSADGEPLKFTDLDGNQFDEGIAVTVGKMTKGDSFTIQPTRNAAEGVGVASTDPSRIALAAPIIASAGTNNAGSLKVDQGSVNADYVGNPLTSPVTLTFGRDAATGGTTFVAPSALTVTVNGTDTTYNAGQTVPYDSTQGAATITMNGIVLNVSGNPEVGDTITVNPNTAGAVTDNRNGLALSALQNDKTQVGGSESYASAYSNMVSYVGSTTNQYKATAAAQQTLLQQAQTAQQSMSGVNLDEEAANMIKFQQLYQANSKVIQSASTMFDTILQIFR